MKKVILITGASSGIGLACANELHKREHIVYGSTRDLKRLRPVPFKPIELDVTDEDSVTAAYRHIVQMEGRVDVLINNAGNGVAGPAYAMPIEAAKQQFEVNFFGVIRMSNAVLPAMISADKGLIINISSLAGLFGLPYQSIYSASKHAVEGYSQSLRMELRNTGVDVVVINPGDFKSGFTASRAKVSATLTHQMLSNEYDTALATIEKDENNAPLPSSLAKLVAKIVASSHVSHRYLAGQLSQTIVPTLKSLLPNTIFEKLMNDHYGIR